MNGRKTGGVKFREHLRVLVGLLTSQCLTFIDYTEIFFLVHFLENIYAFGKI